jgi:hypothetical protein
MKQRTRKKKRPEWDIRPDSGISEQERQIIAEQNALRARLEILAPDREKPNE